MQLLFGLVEFHYRFGLIRIGRWKFRWGRLLYWHTPLRLRWSFRRLRFSSAQPYREFARLLWPWPRRWPCAALPPPPRELFADPDAVTGRYFRDSHVQRQLPLWAARDTPQRAFFRLCEAICAGDDDMIGYATEYLFFHPDAAWALHRLPDPRALPGSPADSAQDVAERLAVMARLLASLEEAFNWRLRLGLRRDGTLVERAPDGTPAPWEPETRPVWAGEIRGLPALLVLSRSWDRSKQPADFKARYNIVIQGGALRTI